MNAALPQCRSSRLTCTASSFRYTMIYYLNNEMWKLTLSVYPTVMSSGHDSWWSWTPSQLVPFWSGKVPDRALGCVALVSSSWPIPLYGTMRCLRWAQCASANPCLPHQDEDTTLSKRSWTYYYCWFHNLLWTRVHHYYIEQQSSSHLQCDE